MEYYKNYDLTDIVYFCDLENILKTEIWKDIVGFEGLYEVSDLGRVKSYYKKIPIILKSKKDKYGYLTLSLCKNKQKKSFTIHRLVALSFISNPKNKPQVNHKNGVKTHNPSVNLEWCNQSENQIHAVENNLQPVGEKHSNSILKSIDVINIRKLKNQKTIKEIALEFNVWKATVRDIFRGATWKHL